MLRLPADRPTLLRSPSLGGTTPRPVFRSRTCRTLHVWARGSASPVPQYVSGLALVESVGPLMSLGEPPSVGALLSDPGRARRQANGAPRCCRRLSTRRRPRQLPSFRGSTHTAPTIAVYASQPGLPRNHARLASGWWPAFAGQGSTCRARFRRFLMLAAAPAVSLHLPLLKVSMTHVPRKDLPPCPLRRDDITDASRPFAPAGQTELRSGTRCAGPQRATQQPPKRAGPAHTASPRQPGAARRRRRLNPA